MPTRGRSQKNRQMQRQLLNRIPRGLHPADIVQDAPVTAPAPAGDINAPAPLPDSIRPADTHTDVTGHPAKFAPSPD